MHNIYNELRSHEGKLTEFGEFMVSKGLFKDAKNGIQALRINVRPNPEIERLYEEWKPGRLKTKDVEKHNKKLEAVFEDLKKKGLKSELLSIVDVMEEALKELTLGIKNMDKEKLLQAKELLSNGLYGGK